MIPSDRKLAELMTTLTIERLGGKKYLCTEDGTVGDDCYSDVFDAAIWACEQMEAEYPDLIKANTDDEYWYDEIREDVVLAVCYTATDSRYVCNIVDGNVDLPDELKVQFTDVEYDEMYEKLSEYVHSFDGIRQVDGRIIDIFTDEDVDYTSSIVEG